MGTRGLYPDWEIPKTWGQQPHLTKEESEVLRAQGFTQVGVHLTLSLGQALKQD